MPKEPVSTRVIRWFATPIGVIIFASVFSSSVLLGQVGTIVDESGLPVQGVLVELWSRETRISVTRSLTDGTFHVIPEALSANRISLRRVGYQPQSAVFSPDLLENAFVLELLPTTLPAIVVEGTATYCPTTADVAARDLVRLTQARYLLTTTGRGSATRHLSVRETVEETSVGFPPWHHVLPSSARHVGATWPPQTGRYTLIDSLIARYGYARRNDLRRGPPLAADFFHWTYPALHARHAAHFASSVFLERHDFRVLDRDELRTVVAFCPKNTSDPEIQGILEIGLDTTFVAASWGFLTPNPSENAGGEAVFTRPGDDRQKVHLLPARGTYWRRVNSSTLFHQRAVVYLSWSISDTDSMPDLPTPSTTP